MRFIANKTLVISNHIFERLGCCALCNKAYISKDDESKLYIKANSLLIDNVNDFIQPRFEYWNHEIENINHKLILDDIKLNNEIRVYPQSINASPLSIKSLLGNDMIVTLKNGNLWYELICEAVKIMGYPKPMVKVYINDAHTPPYQSSTLSTFPLWKQHEHFYNDRGGFTELCFVQFSIEFLYSIEVKGKNNIPPRQLNENESDATWRVGHIMFSQMQLSVSFDRKIIYGNYYSGIEKIKFGGRRTFDGWESQYREYSAFYHKAFELIYDVQKYIDDLPIRSEAINAVVQINDVLDNELCQKEIIIKFKEQITLKKISDILDFDIRGIEYTYYE